MGERRDSVRDPRRPEAVRSAAVPASAFPLASLLLSERPRPSWIRESHRGWWLAVATVCLGAFMGQLDSSIATLTYPALEAQFHAPLAVVEWVSLAYLLALVALLVPAGRLSDARGRKLMYLYGFLAFSASSAGCGLAPNLTVLVACRAIQAVGAALMQANSVALVTTSAPRHRMRAALGVQAGAQALGLALGPTLGGVIVVGLGWRWVFFVNVPVGVIGIVAGHYLLPRTWTRSPADRFDWPGLALLATATTAGLLAVSAASGLGLSPAAVLGLAMVSIAAGFGFVRRIRSAAAPLVDPSLLDPIKLPGRRILPALAAALGGYLVLFGPLVLVPLVLTRAGGSLESAGLALTALPAGFAASALAAERVLPAGWSDRRRAALGAAVALAVLVAMIPAPARAAVLAPLLLLLGLGLGTFTPANNAQVMAEIPAGTAGTGGALVNMARGLGTALGVAVVALALHLGHGAGRQLATAVLAVVAAGVLSLCRRSGP
jgi:MFS family permease